MESLESLMTSEEVARFLHVDPATVRRQISKGLLAAYRVGADYRIAPCDLKDYLQRQRVATKGEIAATTSVSADPFKPFLQWLSALWSEETGEPREFLEQEQTHFNLFSERLRKVVRLAQEAEARLRTGSLCSEHLFLGLTNAGEGVGLIVLKNLGIDLEQVRHFVESMIALPEEAAVVFSPLRFSPKAQKVIEQAVEEARQMQHLYCGTGHLLLGILRADEGIEVNWLQRQQVTQQRAREEMERVLSTMQRKGPDPYPLIEGRGMDDFIAHAKQTVICHHCKVHNLAFLRTCFNCGELLAEQTQSST